MTFVFKRSSYMGIFASTLISLLALLTTPVEAGEIGMSIKEGFLQQTYVNQPVKITAVPLSGTPPYTYQWYTQLWTSVGGGWCVLERH